MFLGIDIGGTYMKVVAIPSGKLTPASIRYAIRFAVRQRMPHSRAALQQTLEKLITRISHGREITKIGVGLPGVLDYKRGILIQTDNNHYLKKWDAKKFFSQFGVPVRIDNDSRCFVRAEATFGAGRKYKNVAGIAIGTGIGGGVMINGTMYYGVHGRAGEIGHMVIELGTKNKELSTLQGLGAKKAFEKRGDRNRAIGIGVANIIHIIDPEIVVLGGGGGLSKNLNLATVRGVANGYLRPPLRGKTLIMKGQLGEYAGAIGAALLVSDKSALQIK